MKTWVVVADSARARIFKPADQGKVLQLVKEYQNPAAQVHERDLATDRPGRTFERNGPGRHAMSESMSPKEHEAWKLSKHLTDEIESARMLALFDRLVIVAAPAFLGQLRKMLTPSAALLVVHELDKNLAQMEPREILTHLPEAALAW